MQRVSTMIEHCPQGKVPRGCPWAGRVLDRAKQDCFRWTAVTWMEFLQRCQAKPRQVAQWGVEEKKHGQIRTDRGSNPDEWVAYLVSRAHISA